ncbi:YniB family protein [Biostraticola tofi]|uniref:YniB-like protein n=1 Tax=Biostraticola tofi TaxID=466109 RepID=A0A4R3Z5H0_9GAMM|nr:YniB family protein [Biostraticola tofi]TCV99714.1 YniB-like protein [Biostraticola tofi]
MTYQQAGRLAVIKRLAGWIIFIPALLSTLISLLKFIYQYSVPDKGINAVMADFFHVIIDMLRFNTSFLNVFWYNSPEPDFKTSLFAGNMAFWLIFMLMFIGLALQSSGARMSRQVRHIREGVEDHMILEQAKGSNGQSRAEIENKIVMPRHTILLQIFPLYILPIIIAVIGYFAFKLLGFI